MSNSVLNISRYVPMHDNKIEVDVIRRAITKIELASIPDASVKDRLNFAPDHTTVNIQLEIIQTAWESMRANNQTLAGNCPA